VSNLAELRRSLARLDPSLDAASALELELGGPRVLALAESWADASAGAPPWLRRRGASALGARSAAPGLAKVAVPPLAATEPRAPSGRLAELLPDGGLPRGAVVELASPRGLGRATSFALAACAAAQREARTRSGDARTVGAWCAFVDPWSSLHAPGLVQRGVDLSRLLVVRPSLEALARIAVRVVESQAFSVVVIDTVGTPGQSLGNRAFGSQELEERVRLERWGTVVRRLAMAIEHRSTTVLLLTDALAARPMPLPVALRIEMRRRFAPADIVSLRVAKERHGRTGEAVDIAV
jgi:recombination protein RecA